MQQISNANITFKLSRVDVSLQLFNLLGVLALEQVLLTILSPHQMCNGQHNLQEHRLFWFDFHSSFGTLVYYSKKCQLAWLHSAKINEYRIYSCSISTLAFVGVTDLEIVLYGASPASKPLPLHLKACGP